MVHSLIFLASFIYLCFSACSESYPNAWVPEGFCTNTWTKSLQTPRQMQAAGNGDILVVESGANQVTALWDDNGDGFSDPNERIVLAQATGLNHGLFIDETRHFLYASSPSTLFRWKYNGERKHLGKGEIVIKNIPPNGHVTRTPVVDSHGNIFLSLGSASNVDDNSQHARVMKFNHSLNFPVDWSAGTLWADGIRNAVALRFDRDGRLWAAVNGMDNIERADLGGDIHNTNPAEELKLLDTVGQFHGYPYCWAEYLIPDGKGKGRGTMWAQEKFMNDGTHTDAWCQDPAHVRKPALALHPHNAPLDILFYYGATFPREYNGDAFVAMHGSWDSDTPVGYRVVRVKYQDNKPVSYEPFFKNNGTEEKWPSTNPFRPVSVTSSQCSRGSTSDCMFVSSDTTGNIVRIKY